MEPTVVIQAEICDIWRLCPFRGNSVLEQKWLLEKPTAGIISTTEANNILPTEKLCCNCVLWQTKVFHVFSNKIYAYCRPRCNTLSISWKIYQLSNSLTQIQLVEYICFAAQLLRQHYEQMYVICYSWEQFKYLITATITRVEFFILDELKMPAIIYVDLEELRADKCRQHLKLQKEYSNSAL